jgi:type II secretory pathway component PulF
MREKKNFLKNFIRDLQSVDFRVSKEKEFLLENLAMLISSGMDIVSILNALQSDMRSLRMKDALEDIKDKIDGGSPIWQALEKNDLFPENVISLVKIGENAGRLPQNLKVIAAQQQKERIFHSRIKSAMLYPVLVLVLTMTIGLGIAWFILPRLASVFSGIKLDLPLVTKILMSIGNFLGEYGAIAIPLFLVFLGIMIYFIFANPKTKFIGQALLFWMPATKKLIQEVELARFGYVLGTLLDAGLPILGALNALQSSSSIFMYRKFYHHLYDHISLGHTFRQSFDKYKMTQWLVPSAVQHMVASAELSGSLPETLLKIGENFESKTESTAKNLTVLLEPILLVIVWLGVLAVALAVILPIYNLVGGINR